MKIKSEFIHYILSTVIALTIVLFPAILGNKIMWNNYTHCNVLTPVGRLVSYVWLAVIFTFVLNELHNFLKKYTDYE